MSRDIKSSVVALLYPGCIFFELALVMELLANKFQIVCASPDGSDHFASNGSVLRVSAAYGDVDFSACRAVLVPGGNPTSIIENKEIDRLIYSANSKELLIGAICAGPSVLAKAKILSGKKVAHGYRDKQLAFVRSSYPDTEWVEDRMVCDGQIITAKPDAHIDFAVEIACKLGVIDRANADRVMNYYRGILVH